MKEFAISFNCKHPLKQTFVKRAFKMQKAEFGKKVWVWRKIYFWSLTLILENVFLSLFYCNGCW